MKNLFATLFLMLSVNLVQAQKCTFTVDQKDPSTGVATQKIMVTIKDNFHLWFNRVGVDKSISFEIVFADIKKEVIHKGDTLVLQMSNDDFITLVAVEDATPAGKADDVVEITNYYPIYNLSPADLNRVLAARIVGIKMYFGKEFNVWEFNEKQGKKILEAANCIK
jgi:hypothetical protein